MCARNLAIHDCCCQPRQPRDRADNPRLLVSIAGWRDACTAVGGDTFAAVIDNLADKDVTALIKKFDKLWPELSSASLPSQREHVMALAVRRAEPTVKRLLCRSLASLRRVSRKLPG